MEVKIEKWFINVVSTFAANELPAPAIFLHLSYIAMYNPLLKGSRIAP